MPSAIFPPTTGILERAMCPAIKVAAPAISPMLELVRVFSLKSNYVSLWVGQK